MCGLKLCVCGVCYYRLHNVLPNPVFHCHFNPESYEKREFIMYNCMVLCNLRIRVVLNFLDIFYPLPHPPPSPDKFVSKAEPEVRSVSGTLSGNVNGVCYLAYF